jgi:hypothetical protein
VTRLALGAGGARRDGAPFGPVGWHGCGLVVAGHGKQSSDWQWRVEQQRKRVRGDGRNGASLHRGGD